jgi:hypothetical protein
MHWNSPPPWLIKFVMGAMTGLAIASAMNRRAARKPREEKPARPNSWANFLKD